MSANPSFASTPNIGVALLGNAETDLQVPTTTSVVLTAGTNGTKIEEIVVEASKAGSLVATTVAGLVYLFLYDGSLYHLFDVITVTAQTGSATALTGRWSNRYTNLWLKSGWSLRSSQSISGNASLLNCFAFGADL